jgi:hypothetical protein
MPHWNVHYVHQNLWLSILTQHCFKIFLLRCVGLAVLVHLHPVWWGWPTIFLCKIIQVPWTFILIYINHKMNQGLRKCFVDFVPLLRQGHSYIEVLNVNPRHKKAIILLVYRTFVKVLKDALAHSGPYQTWTKVRYSDPGGAKSCSFAHHNTNLKIPIQAGFVWWFPIVSSKYRYLYQFCYVTLLITSQNENLMLLDDPGRVRSQITSVVCQIQWFNFDCNLGLTRKLIIRIPAGLGLNPL